MVLLEHFEALEADFRRFYHLDLAECVWPVDGGGLSVRRFEVLLRALPAESAFARSITEGPLPAYSYTEELLASHLEAVIESTRILRDTMIALWSKKGPGPRQAAASVPRPWDRTPADRAAVARGEAPERPAKRQATPEELAAFFKATGARVTVGRGNTEKG